VCVPIARSCNALMKQSLFTVTVKGILSVQCFAKLQCATKLIDTTAMAGPPFCSCWAYFFAHELLYLDGRLSPDQCFGAVEAGDRQGVFAHDDACATVSPCRAISENIFLYASVTDFTLQTSAAAQVAIGLC
jgi:hypothetical protein